MKKNTRVNNVQPKQSSFSFYRKFLLILCLLLVSSVIVYVSKAAISLSTTTSYTQNFDSIGTTATATLPADFRLDRPSAVRTVGSFASATTATTQVGGANLSTSATNGAYNFGSGTTTTGGDRAIGFLSSGSATQSGNLYAQLVNNTGGGLTALRISYDVEKYRNGSNAAGFRIQMFYSLDGTSWTSAGNNFRTFFAGTADNTGFANAPGATVSVTDQSLNASIPDGSNFYLAWNYSVDTGSTTTNAQALAIDNISILGVAGPTDPTGVGAANPNQVFAGGSSLLTVTVTPGSNPTSTGITVTGNLSAIGGSATQTFFDNGTNGDVTAGDNIFSYNATVANGTTAGVKNLPITVADGQSRSSNTSISLEVIVPPFQAGSVVISQLYGGGGNSGATFRNDFVELFNRSNTTVDLTGWSVQYASQAGNFGGSTSRTTLSGTLAPGHYYLVQLAAGAGGSQNLPTPDATGSTNMSATDGKVALVSNSTFLSGACPLSNSNLIDFVGYGGANCSEGGATAPQLSNTTAAKRSRDGCRDTDVNAANFAEVSPSPRNTSDTANFCPAGDDAPEVFTTSPVNSASNVLHDANISITFDEAVNVTGSWYQISCSVSSFVTATVTGGPATFTLNPDANLVGDEICTVTVYAANVNDVDTDDPPDFMVSDYTFTFRVTPDRSPAEHLVMGNPTNATVDENFPENYLLLKNQYVMSYNRDKGTANWVSWHLDNTWLGTAPRQDDFRNDPSLPAGWYQVLATDYQLSGFDRGHMSPSADRTSTIPDNSATFFMTNMMPQSPDNNQGPWAILEGYARTLVSQGNEVYIISGGAGVGGTGSNGSAQTIANGRVTVPAFTWKVLLVLPVGDDDVSRVNNSTRAIAVIMPNIQGIRSVDWRKYLSTVDQVEELTGYDFFSNVPTSVQQVIESRVDALNDTAPQANNSAAVTDEDNSVSITLTATDFNINNELTFSVVNAPANGTLGDFGAVTCNSGSCSVTLTYTPNGNFNGSDSFTFKTNDTALDSNEATVNITVNAVNDAPTLSGVPISATIDELVAYTFTAQATDVDQSQTLTFSLVGAPAGASINPTTGEFSWTPTEAQGGTGTPFDFTVRLTDGIETVESNISITVNEVNQTPTLDSIGNRTVYLGNTLLFTATGHDSDVPAQTLSYSLLNAPAGATIDSNSGAFSWTPSAGQAGAVYLVTVRVTDSYGANAEEQIAIGVAFTWSGLLPPINTSNGIPIFKIGRTIPVKFALTGASSGVTNAIARLTLAKITNDVVGTEVEAESTSAATEGNLFRYDAGDNQYIFNLNTKGLTPGTYQLRVDMGDGVQRITLIALKN